MTPFATSLEHLLAELDRMDIQVRLRLWRAQEASQGKWAEPAMTRGLSGDGGLPNWSSLREFPTPDWVEAFTALSEDLHKRKASSLEQGIALRFVDFAQHFSLTTFDADLFLVALIAEIDTAYERVFAYLNGSAGRIRPTADLALNLVCSSLGEKLDATARLFPDAPLIRFGLVHLFEDGGPEPSPWLSRIIKLDERIVRFLLGSDEIEPKLAPFLEKHTAHVLDTPTHIVDAVRKALAGRAPAEPLVVQFHGAGRADGRSAAHAASLALGMTLLVLDGEAVAAAREGAEPLLAEAMREAMLQHATLYMRDSPKVTILPTILRQLTRYPDVVMFVETEGAWEPIDSAPAIATLSLEVPLPRALERATTWKSALGEGLPETLEDELSFVATKFRFTHDKIRAAADGAARRARWRAAASVPTVDDVYESCHAHSNRKLDELARRIKPRYRWDDIVLSDDSLQQLREIRDRVVHRGRVLDEWGFSEKLSLGRGLNVLFAGPSGTGKTMAAEIVANELRLDLFRIDLSSVVSKYIGETEKNLARIFTEAETSNAILFFDEADSLFGKRSEVKDAHDRYANIETSYLLQRMEEYEGMTILATNLRRNLDDAFARRMAFTVIFSQPEELERLRIWQRVWPTTTPLDGTVDLEFMARQFKLTGANIKNIAIAAAFLAASEDSKVTMRHLLRGTRRELQKLGKTAVSSDFGPYASLEAAEPLLPQ